MFIISSAPPAISRCASANVRALSVSASSWLCSAMTPAPQHEARSSSTSSMSSSGATLAMEPWSSGVKPRLTHPGQYATLIRESSRDGCEQSRVRAPLGRGRGRAAVLRRARRGRRAVGGRAVALVCGRPLVVGLDDVEVELVALLLAVDRVEDPPDVLHVRDLVTDEGARR